MSILCTPNGWKAKKHGLRITRDLGSSAALEPADNVNSNVSVTVRPRIGNVCLYRWISAQKNKKPRKPSTLRGFF